MTNPELIVITIYAVVAIALSFITAFMNRELNVPLIVLYWMWPFMIFLGVIMAISVGPAALGEYLGNKRK